MDGCGSRQRCFPKKVMQGELKKGVEIHWTARVAEKDVKQVAPGNKGVEV